ncbi:uncharacterized protein Z520_10344 [Fonsecaea multimorphosa CBS 102226]|uniref:Uncharacterized protein n=1 Tax=Fonsecaea multimorphosa CBS 102226 TaxID=1442371 RepID=A0A0D2JL65_9EURO|nr:uncharacterized protein Z520_10344 [Fonsecaea multimorphosa CBS 102226]KIX94007.1 hypothetical protein Z520_10344 [Fonsecaea multimorphosa CBS 102226]OAL19353.1 hypothetical protein AYO22_09897 [Fonsecaea multimorphosa]
MIPWAAFSTSAQEPDWRVELNAENIYYYVEHGPTQYKRTMDSPMLGLAHERQFAISQLGTKSVGFEQQHIALMQQALQQLNTHFTTHSTHEPCHPTSPHSEDLTDCRQPVDSYSPLPPLDISDEPCFEPLTPSPVTELERCSRSPLNLQELMNPVPLTPASLKRKSSDDLLPSILADDEAGQGADVEEDSLLPRHSLIYPRASHILSKGEATRTRRGVRMRRGRSIQRHHSMQNSHETERFEKEGQLLLNLAQSPRSMGYST